MQGVWGGVVEGEEEGEGIYRRGRGEEKVGRKRGKGKKGESDES